MSCCRASSCKPSVCSKGISNCNIVSVLSQFSFTLLIGSSWDNESSPCSYCTTYRLHISMVRKCMLPQSSVIQLVNVDANMIRWKKCDAEACRLKLSQRLHSTENVSEWKLGKCLSDFSLIFLRQVALNIRTQKKGFRTQYTVWKVILF